MPDYGLGTSLCSLFFAQLIDGPKPKVLSLVLENLDVQEGLGKG